MNLTSEQVLDSALALPDEERLELVEALMTSLRPGDRPPFDDAWREMIRRRSEELKSGMMTPVRWEDVKRRAWDDVPPQYQEVLSGRVTED